MKQPADDRQKGREVNAVGGASLVACCKGPALSSCMQNYLTSTRALRLCPSEHLCRSPGWLQSNAKCRHRGDANTHTHTHTQSLQHSHTHIRSHIQSTLTYAAAQEKERAPAPGTASRYSYKYTDRYTAIYIWKSRDVLGGVGQRCSFRIWDYNL